MVDTSPIDSVPTRRFKEEFISLPPHKTACRLHCKCGKLLEKVVREDQSAARAMRLLHREMDSHNCGEKASGQQGVC